MKRNLIIVGNGSSLLDKDNGKTIDGFDYVLRFNSFKTKGFEKYTGKKTDIWFTVNGHHINTINNFKEVYVHSWQWDKEKCKLYQRLIKKRKDCIKIERNFVKENIPVLDAPSTGIIAIFFFLPKFEKITITGFDWWSRTKHHYGDNEKRGSLHNPNEEFKVISKLINDGRVVFL